MSRFLFPPQRITRRCRSFFQIYIMLPDNKEQNTLVEIEVQNLKYLAVSLERKIHF